MAVHVRRSPSNNYNQWMQFCSLETWIDMQCSSMTEKPMQRCFESPWQQKGRKKKLLIRTSLIDPQSLVVKNPSQNLVGENSRALAFWEGVF